MDNICHTLVGAALAEAGLKRRTPRAYATLLIGANLPDLDGLAMFTGQSLSFRRGITHGVPALIVLPFLLAGAMMLVGWVRKSGEADGQGGGIRFRHLLPLAAIAIATHPFLDWLNTYGMRWLMPFSGRWFYGDSLFIVDPWLYLVLGGGVLAARMLGRSGSSRSELPARVSLLLAAGYIAGMLGLTNVGRRIASRDLGLVNPGPRRLMVEPVAIQSWRRQVVVDAGDRYRFGEIEWLPRPVLRMGALEIPKGMSRDDMERLPLDARARHFLDWARFPFAVTDGEAVRLNDARYSRGGASWAMVTVPRRQEAGGSAR